MGGVDPELYNTYFYVEDISGEDNELIITKNDYPVWTVLKGKILNLEYSYDQINWIELNTPTLIGATIHVQIPPNTKIYLRGENETSEYHNITCLKNYAIGGNLLSILYSSDFINKNSVPTNRYDSFAFLFKSSITLIYSHNLILKSEYLTERCYLYLFSYCTNMQTSVKNLPAKILNRYCYGDMFTHCYNLINAPIISPYERVSYWGVNFNKMFGYCNKLPYLKTYFTMDYNNDRGEGYIFSNWLQNVSPIGTFLLPVGSTFADDAPRDGSGIPSGWEIKYFNPETDEIIN